MWIQVNKETKRIESYIRTGKPIVKEGYDLIEVDEIPEEWYFSKYIDGEFILDEIFKSNELEEQDLKDIRFRRETECFPYINRGALWYDLLTNEQKEELKLWYQSWLDVTETKEIPTRPEWLK